MKPAIGPAQTRLLRTVSAVGGCLAAAGAVVAWLSVASAESAAAARLMTAVPAASSLANASLELSRPFAVAPAALKAAAVTRAMAPRFLPNGGQWPAEVAYAVLGDTAAWLHPDGYTLQFARHVARATVAADALVLPATEQVGCVLRTRFRGAAATAEFRPGLVLPGQHHFLRGGAAGPQCIAVTAHADVVLGGFLPGIDIVYRPLPPGQAGPFAYDLLLARGADLSSFVAVVDGVDSLGIDSEGRLVLRASTPLGEVELRQDAPVAWQDTPMGRQPLTVRFRLLGERSYGFVADRLDPQFPATVDPGVVWSTYFGGGGADSINDFAWRPGQGLWVAGWAGSTDFPTTAGAFRRSGGRDGFVARLSEDGQSLLYATYLGGGDADEVRGIDVAANLEPVVVGFTRSFDFPVTAGALQRNYGGASLILELGDAFVTRLTADGSAVVGSTFLGGSLDDIAEAVVVDDAGFACVTGWTASDNFPTTPGAWRPFLGGPLTLQTDGFVTRLAPDCRSAAYSTYIGGALPDQLQAIALLPQNAGVVVAGWSVSANFPVTGTAYRTSISGGVDIVVVGLNASGSAPLFSTYIGGQEVDLANAVAVAADGSIWVAGKSNSNSFPATPTAAQRQLAGGYDGVLCRLNSNGTNLLHATFLGGPQDDQIRGLAVAGDDILVVGEASAGFPTTANAVQAHFGGGSLDGFYARYRRSDVALQYATYCGGVAQDVLSRVQISPGGLAVLSGWSFAADFPVTPGALQSELRGIEDGVLLQLDLQNELTDGLMVAAAGSPGIELVPPGQHEVLRVELTNRAQRWLRVESLRLLLCGAGATPALVRNLRVYAGDPAAPQQYWPVSGSIAVVEDNAELTLPLDDLWLPVGQVLQLQVRAEVVGDPSGATAEFAALLAGSDFVVQAEGIGSGPSVRVQGDPRIEGPVLVVGALPGDADGNTRRNVVDLRLLCRRLGQLDRAVDTDGDGVLTLADVEHTRNALLGRGTVLSVPSSVERTRYFALPGVYPTAGIVEASLGGRSLASGRLTPRQLTLRVDGNQPTGLQELRVSLNGRLLWSQTVQVW